MKKMYRKKVTCGLCRKMLGVMLAIVMMMGLVACGSGDSNQAENNAGNEGMFLTKKMLLMKTVLLMKAMLLQKMVKNRKVMVI